MGFKRIVGGVMLFGGAVLAHKVLETAATNGWEEFKGDTPKGSTDLKSVLFWTVVAGVSLSLAEKWGERSMKLLRNKE